MTDKLETSPSVDYHSMEISKDLSCTNCELKNVNLLCCWYTIIFTCVPFISLVFYFTSEIVCLSEKQPFIEVPILILVDAINRIVVIINCLLTKQAQKGDYINLIRTIEKIIFCQSVFGTIWGICIGIHLVYFQCYQIKPVQINILVDVIIMYTIPFYLTVHSRQF
jgi:hypothetical protein